jgi:hypothetical protein
VVRILAPVCLTVDQTSGKGAHRDGHVAGRARVDVNAYGRGDALVEEAWETALHHSAVTGNVELTRRLLDLGADPNLRDQRFDAIPLDWARPFHQLSTAALLEPVTAPLANGE